MLELEQKVVKVVAEWLEEPFNSEEVLENAMQNGLEFQSRLPEPDLDFSELYSLSNITIENEITFEEIDDFVGVTEQEKGNKQKIKDIIQKAKELNKENRKVSAYEDEFAYVEEPLPDVTRYFEEEFEEEFEEAEEEVFPEEKLSPKAQKLLEKVDNLCEKIEQEKNPLKLHILKFQVRMLQARIQRELDLINLKEDYQVRREQLRNNKEMRDDENIVSVAELADQIRVKKSKLNSNKDYDYENNEFLYPKNIVESKGGIDQLVESLKQSGSPAAQSTAKRIEEIAKVKEELNDLENELAEKQENLSQSDKEFNKENRKLNFEEKRLTVVNKINVFSRIGDFFKAIGDGIKDFRAERAAIKAADEEFKQQEEEIKNEYKRRIEELKMEKEAAKESKTNERKEKFLNDIQLTGADLEKANEPVNIEQLANETIVEAHSHDEDAQDL